jgi:hypothetical protein
VRYRITVRGDGTELRGYLDGSAAVVVQFTEAMKPYGFVVISEATPDYDPFKEQADDPR